MRYEDASHTGAFQGQGPVANDDLEMVAAGSKSAATGNLITGDGTQSGSAGADSAAGAHITAIAGKSGEDTSFAGGKLSVEGDYGKLSVDAEGNYVYQANKGVENVRDRFTYTLADNQGATDSAALIVEIGKTPVVIKADAQQIVPGPDGVVTLPPGVELSDVHVVGRNLVIDLPDGTQLIIVDGAVFVPQLVINGVEIPATNVAALLVGQEIQPAAGELPPSSGGNFAVPPPPLDPGVPLGDLIPPTEYVYQPPEPQEVLDIEDSEPEAGVATALLDDDAQAGGNPLSNVGDDPGTNVATGNLPGSGGDGALEWALLASGTLPAGLNFSFAPQLNGDLWILQGGVHVLTIHVNPVNGDFTVTQVAAIDHTAGGDENNAIFVIDYSVTDEDGDVATGTLTIDVDDDTPSVSVQAGADAAVILTTDDAQTIGAASDTAVTAANFSGVFGGTTVVFGADGSGPGTSSTYALAITSSNSGLTSHGTAINLYVVGGVVIGSTAATAGAIDAGNTIFTVSTTNAGVVTLTQFQQIDHPLAQDPTPSGAPFADQVISMVDGLVTLTRSETVVDGDGDQVTGSATVNIGANLHFTDDGPTIGLADQGEPVLNVDESNFAGNDTESFAGNFTANFGADGPGGISYTLGVIGANAVSGLVDTLTGQAVVLNIVGGQVVGTAGVGGPVVFTVSVDANGNVTLDQSRAVIHSPDSGPDQTTTLSADNLVTLTATATDFDGDTDSETINIGLNLTFDDDAPSVTATLLTGTVDEDGVPGGIADGPQDVAGEDTTATGNVSGLFNSGADQPLSFGLVNDTSGLPALTSGGLTIHYSITGNTLTAYTGADPSLGQVFTFTVNATTGAYTFTLLDQVDHPTLNGLPGDDTENDLAINLGALIEATDEDGDSVIANANSLIITIDDDTPVARNDSDTLPSGSNGPETGNVITGTGTAGGTGGAGADSPGADSPATIIAIAGAGGTDTTFTAGLLSIAGAHGTLTMDANGNYSYTRTDNVPGTLQDVFTYTYEDADGDKVTATLTINMSDDTPTLPDPDLIRLDDDVIPGANGNPDGPNDDDPDAPDDNVVSGQLNGSGGNGDLDYAFTGTNTLPAGFSIGAGSDADTLIIVQDQNGSDVTVMTIQLNLETGAFTVTQNNPIWHPTLNGAAGDDTENNLLFSIGVEVVDADGDDEPATITINVDDDTPTINVTKGDDSAVSLTTDDADTIGVATDTASTSANFGGVFALAQSAGADGTNAAATLLYTLDVTGFVDGGPAGVNSGLESHNADIFLYEIGGKVVGSTSATLAGVNAGNTVFDVGVNGSGVVTLTQYQQIDHDTADPTPTGSPFADHIVSLTDNLITLTASASLTDKDGDTVTDSETVNIGANLHFTDDGPDADVSGVAVGTVTLDETRAEGTDTVGGTLPNGDQSATIDFSANFVTGGSVDYGADGPGSVTYALQLTGTNVNSGLYALDNTDTVVDGDGYGQGGQIVLNQSGNTITGSFNGTNYFTITIDPATGIVTFTQINNIWHPTAGSSAAALDETATLNTLAANLIQVIQTVTDFDGDTDTASIDVGQGVFKIQDDGPRFGPDIDATLSILNDANPSNTGDLDIVIGTDSPNGGVAGPPVQNPDDLSVANFTVLVNGQPVTETLTPGTETATTANYTFSFQYNTGAGGTATANGTLIFHKDTGTYDVALTNGPLQGFTILQTSSETTTFVEYDLNGGAPDVVTAQLATNLFAQFTAVSTANQSAFEHLGTSAGNDAVWNPNELFIANPGNPQVSNTDAGVDGNTMDTGEVLDFDLFTTDPGSNTSATPNGFATEMFMQFFQYSGDDLIVILKLQDANNPAITTTRAIMISSTDVFVDGDDALVANTPYANLVAGLGSQDALVVIQSNDYNAFGENWVIVGAQIVTDEDTTSGIAIDLDRDLGVNGASDRDQDGDFTTDSGNAALDEQDSFADDVDVSGVKITSIGFLVPDTTSQSATIDFDVIIHDADGDTATQHITVDIGDTQSALLPPAPESFSTMATESLLASDSDDQQVQKTAANSNTLTMAAAVAAAGLAESAAASPPADDQSFDSLEAQAFTSQVVESLPADDGGDDSSAVSGLAETQEADEAAGNSGGHSQGDEHRSDASLDAASNNQSSDQGSEHQAANDDQGPASVSADASPAALSVAMVSAEALQVAGLVDNAQHGGAVEKIIAEALGQGNGHGAVDALLDAFQGGSGGGAAIANLASSNANAVSAWDMASDMGSNMAHEMLMKVGAQIHHDMVPPTHNG